MQKAKVIEQWGGCTVATYEHFDGWGCGGVYAYRYMHVPV